MKKSLAALLTGALVVGAASTTFAAANPFSDVPTGHWAYDAVAQLARDGVINGYGDSTFRGDRNITRYEMAQMIAKAMAKQPKSGVDKALLDKLVAEFRDELDNLGVRVAKLEKHADMVKWNGELRYRYWSNRNDDRGWDRSKNNLDRLELRLMPTAEINDNWNVKARLDVRTNMKTDSGDDGNVKLKYAFAEGTYNNFQVKLGKMPLYTLADDGLVLDGFFSGASASFGKNVKLVAQGGRWKLSDTESHFATEDLTDQTANYWGVELVADMKKLKGGVGYHHFMSDAFRYSKEYKDWSNDSAGIWTVGANYKFDKNFGLAAAYARNQKADWERDAYNIQVNYKGIEKANKGTWGAHVAYRKLGTSAALAPTYDTAAHMVGVKGWDFGLDYIPFKNVQTSIAYFHGKNITQIDSDRDNAKVLFGRVSFFF